MIEEIWGRGSYGSVYIALHRIHVLYTKYIHLLYNVTFAPTLLFSLWIKTILLLEYRDVYIAFLGTNYRVSTEIPSGSEQGVN